MSSQRRCRLAIEQLESRLVPTVFVVNTTLDTDDAQPFDPNGDTSLRKAVRLANFDTDLDTITFAAELSGETIVLSGSRIDDPECA